MWMCIKIGGLIYIYIYIYSYARSSGEWSNRVAISVHCKCHVISHGDDRNKINTILPLEWTVATRQKVTVKKECRSQRGYQQVLVLSNLRSPDTGREEREAKWLAGAPKRKWGSPQSAEIDIKKVSFWAGLVADRPIAIYSGLKTKEYLRHDGPQVLQASVKK